MNKARFLVMMLLCSFATKVNAQYDPHITNYEINQGLYNPAFVGTHDYASASLLIRKDVNFLSFPDFTTSLSYDTPLSGKNMGIGGVLMYDEFGASTSLKLVGQYSYSLPLGNNGTTFSFGGLVGVERRAFNKSRLHGAPGDPLLEENLSAWHPKLGAGLYFNKANKFFVGASIPSVIRIHSKSFDFDEQERNVFFTSGYVLNISDRVVLRPSILMAVLDVYNNHLSLDLSAVLYEDFLIGGGFHPTSNTFSVKAGYFINNNFRVNYSYDVLNATYWFFSSGTHEIVVSFDFGKAEKTRPRFF